MALAERLFFLRKQDQTEEIKISPSQYFRRFHDIVDRLAESPHERAVKYAYRPLLINTWYIPLTQVDLPESLKEIATAFKLNLDCRLPFEAISSYEKDQNRSSLKFHFKNISESSHAVVSFNLYDQYPKISTEDFSHHANIPYNLQEKVKNNLKSLDQIVKELNKKSLRNKAKMFLEFAEFVNNSPRSKLPKKAWLYRPEGIYRGEEALRLVDDFEIKVHEEDDKIVNISESA